MCAVLQAGGDGLGSGAVVAGSSEREAGSASGAELEGGAPDGLADPWRRRAGLEMVARRGATACGAAASIDGLPVEVARGLQAGSADPHMLREPGEAAEPWRSTH